MGLALSFLGTPPCFSSTSPCFWRDGQIWLSLYQIFLDPLPAFEGLIWNIASQREIQVSWSIARVPSLVVSWRWQVGHTFVTWDFIGASGMSEEERCCISKTGVTINLKGENETYKQAWNYWEGSLGNWGTSREQEQWKKAWKGSKRRENEKEKRWRERIEPTQRFFWSLIPRMVTRRIKMLMKSNSSPMLSLNGSYLIWPAWTCFACARILLVS